MPYHGHLQAESHMGCKRLHLRRCVQQTADMNLANRRKTKDAEKIKDAEIKGLVAARASNLKAAREQKTGRSQRFTVQKKKPVNHHHTQTYDLMKKLLNECKESSWGNTCAAPWSRRSSTNKCFDRQGDWGRIVHWTKRSQCMRC